MRPPAGGNSPAWLTPPTLPPDGRPPAVLAGPPDRPAPTTARPDPPGGPGRAVLCCAVVRRCLPARLHAPVRSSLAELGRCSRSCRQAVPRGPTPRPGPLLPRRARSMLPELSSGHQPVADPADGLDLRVGHPRRGQLAAQV